jgi:hypothetical protein
VSSRPQAGRVRSATGEASPRSACPALISQHLPMCRVPAFTRCSGTVVRHDTWTVRARGGQGRHVGSAGERGTAHASGGGQGGGLNPKPNP